MGAASPSSHRATVLVVEDDHTLRELLVMMFADEGYRVVAAADGLDALELTRDERPDVILVDAGMPRLDGAGFCRAYREAGGSVPVILISAADPKIVAAMIADCGTAAYVRKPFEVDDVLATAAANLAR